MKSKDILPESERLKSSELFLSSTKESRYHKALLTAEAELEDKNKDFEVWKIKTLQQEEDSKQYRIQLKEKEDKIAELEKDLGRRFHFDEVRNQEEIANRVSIAVAQAEQEWEENSSSLGIIKQFKIWLKQNGGLSENKELITFYSAELDSLIERAIVLFEGEKDKDEEIKQLKDKIQKIRLAVTGLIEGFLKL